MTRSPDNRGIKRIVIGLKATSDADASIRAATTIAAALEAEVLGLFVEENAMMDLAGLPFARALASGGIQRTSLTPEKMTKALASSALVCRQCLSAHAERARVKWTFSTEQGDLPGRTRAALAGGDFLVLAGEGPSFGTGQLIDELRSAPAEVNGLVVTAWHAVNRARGPVIAIDDGDAAGKFTIALAVRIAEITDSPLHLFVIARTDLDADRIIQRAEDIAGPGRRVFVNRFPPGSTQSLASTLIQLGPLFVVGDLEGEPFQDDQSAISLFRAAQAPVVLVRSDDHV